ncbi:MarR family winged helix-turn-helix transcriptional regulator [Massilia putida]|uniref:MarR family winged helix-turn-helix transcriptional regulator n=1 Tax=Massilia putida TaxID=1141883 RepID=UPI0009519D86|nr:MarR family transcriptional regulator [Massilia putida]
MRRRGPRPPGGDAERDPLLAERFAIALHAAARAWRVALDNRLKDLAVGSGAWMAIAVLARSDTVLSQRALADRLGIEAPSMGLMIDRLVDAGLVARTACPGDRRIKHVRLTDAGRERYGRVHAEARAFHAHVLADVDQALVERVTSLFETLRDRAAERCLDH